MYVMFFWIAIISETLYKIAILVRFVKYTKPQEVSSFDFRTRVISTV